MVKKVIISVKLRSRYVRVLNRNTFFCRGKKSTIGNVCEFVSFLILPKTNPGIQKNSTLTVLSPNKR